MELMSSRVLPTAWKPKNLNFFSKKVEIEFWLVFRLVPKSWNHPSFVNISPILVIGTWMERFLRVLKHGNLKNGFSFLKNGYLSVSAVMFWKQFLAYTVHIDWWYHAIHKHSCRFQHIYIYICVNYLYFYVSTSLHHWTFILFNDIGDASSSLRGSTSSFVTFSGCSGKKHGTEISYSSRTWQNDLGGWSDLESETKQGDKSILCHILICKGWPKKEKNTFIKLTSWRFVKLSKNR